MAAKNPFLMSAALISVGIMILALFGDQGVLQIVSLRKELTRLAERNRTLTERNSDLRREIELLKNDSWASERIAREQLGLIRADERVYRFSN